MVRLVQLVEHQIVVLGVVGSSPTSHPKNKNDLPRNGEAFFCFWGASAFDPRRCAAAPRGNGGKDSPARLSPSPFCRPSASETSVCPRPRPVLRRNSRFSASCPHQGPVLRMNCGFLSNLPHFGLSPCQPPLSYNVSATLRPFFVSATAVWGRVFSLKRPRRPRHPRQRARCRNLADTLPVHVPHRAFCVILPGKVPRKHTLLPLPSRPRCHHPGLLTIYWNFQGILAFFRKIIIIFRGIVPL